jgi:hypothetical protein
MVNDDETFAPNFFCNSFVNYSTHNHVDFSAIRNPVTGVVSAGAEATDQFPATLTVSAGIAADFDVPLQVNFSIGRGPSGVPSAPSGTGDLTLEAVEFWPYKNRLGQDVYDTSSGAEINDPFA